MKLGFNEENHQIMVFAINWLPLGPQGKETGRNTCS
jgi:hypothetical protein